MTFSADNSSSKVEIEGRAPTLQTETAEVSREYDSVTIRALPVLDRQNHELISLMPGITPPQQGDRVTDPQRTRSFNVNGHPRGRTSTTRTALTPTNLSPIRAIAHRAE